MILCKRCGEEIPKDWTMAFRINQYTEETKDLVTYHLTCIPKFTLESDQKPNRMKRIWNGIKTYLFTN